MIATGEVGQSSHSWSTKTTHNALLCLAFSLLFTALGCTHAPDVGATTRTEDSRDLSKPQVPNFFDDDQCEALAAWLRPLKSEYPDVRWSSLREREGFQKQKFLFSDESFVATFGATVDELGNGPRSKIRPALDPAHRHCKSYNSKTLNGLILSFGFFREGHCMGPAKNLSPGVHN